MLTRNEVVQLLQIAAAFDGRKPSEATVHAWMDAAERGRWIYADAAEAIKDYYAEADDSPWVMPGHITVRLRHRRGLPPPPEHLELAGAPPADPGRVHAMVEQLSRELGWTERKPEPEQQRRTDLRVECPHCHAQPGNPCTRQVARGPRRGQFMPISGVHPSRAELAGPEVA